MKILKFKAVWCKPCATLTKMLETANLGIPVEEVDIDDNPGLAQLYSVRGIPTLVLLDDKGAEFRRISGLPTKAQLDSLKD